MDVIQKIRVEGFNHSQIMAFLEQNTKEQQKYLKAADNAITFLIARDERFEKTKQVFLQLSVTGRRGDVRNREIGISAFQITWISAKLGKEWFNVPCSDLYFQDIKPVFEVLSRRGGIYHRKKRDFMFPF